MAATETELKAPCPVLVPPVPQPSGRRKPVLETAFGSPRDFLDNHFVYVVVSARARGLSVGVNVNPDKRCNFDCVYCEVDRSVPPGHQNLDVDVMAAELARTLEFVHAGRLRERHSYGGLPEDLLQLRHVTLSGDGEPTLSPQFAEAVHAVMHIRALRQFPFFKVVLITNGTGLDSEQVQYGMKFLTRQDEIWVKLDAGTQRYFELINRPQIPLEKVLTNIRALGQQRPIVIQSLFLAFNGQEPPVEEIDAYATQLMRLREAGTQISLVQIYSATRPAFQAGCEHLSLRHLSAIAQTVRLRTGLTAEVF